MSVPGVTITSYANIAPTISVGNSKEATIPCFDLRDIDSLTPSSRANIIQKFGDALRDIGFIALYAPEITPKVKAAIDVMKCYFAQNPEIKMKDYHENNGQTGFSPQGLEAAAGSKVPDKKETFFVLPDMASWPTSVPEFKSVTTDYLNTMGDYSSKVIRLLLEYLGELDENVINNGERRVRLAYYPERKKEDSPEVVWAAAHQDLNAITLLPRPSRSGLELKTKEGQWLPVECPEDYIIVNCGDQVTKKTAGYIEGTEHQVVNNDPDNLDPRYSTILFAAFPSDYSLKPFESCAEKATKGMSPSEAGAYLSQFPDVTVSQNLFARLIEMGSVPNVTEEQIKELLGIGLIQNPSAPLKEKFPNLFN